MCVETKGVFMAECKNMREKRKEKSEKRTVTLPTEVLYCVIDLHQS